MPPTLHCMMPFSLEPGLRAVLLTAALLAGCAAGDGPRTAGDAPRGAFGPYLAGRFASSEADSAMAAAQLGEALRQDPDQIEVLQQAFGAAVMNGQSDATRLARRLPEDQLANLLLAGADAQAGRWDRTEQRLRTLPRRGSAQLLQPLLVAWAQAGRGDTAQALALLRPFIEDGRLRGVIALHAAMIADLGGQPQDAARYLRLAIADTQEPNLRLAQIGAGIFARAGQEAQGARLFDVMARGNDDIAMAVTPALRQKALQGRAVASATEGMAEAQVAFGAALRSQGGPDLALMLSRLALRLRPDFAPALLLAADSLADQKHTDRALAMLETVPERDPLAPLVALRRASLLDAMGRTAEAEALLRHLAQGHPQAVQPVAQLGDMLRTRGRFGEASAAYGEALARARADGSVGWPLYYAQGIAMERDGCWTEAEASFRRALALAPDQPSVLNYLAYSWAERGERLPEAKRMLERAAALRPQDGNIADSLGWVLLRQGDLPKAVQTLERAVELESRNSTINEHLGDAYWAVGRRTEARYQWRRALDLAPASEDRPRLSAKLRDGLQTSPAASAMR
ncbi:tetratricopeptide repeat protein [Roseomonas mucosa]|nr:tetratricopeptide repeat protein [Roseomonas mucosa]MDT8276917.1 tetratricopeptide repeat protein [Roseomonas mucosa]